MEKKELRNVKNRRSGEDRRRFKDPRYKVYDEAAERINAAAGRLSAAEGVYTERTGSGAGSSGIRLEPFLTQQRFEAMVRQCKEYNAAGDIYQANLSQQFSAEAGDRDPLRLYEVLRGINPSPFAAYAELDGLTVVSSSPERLVRLAGRVADTRPIAGTRRRVKDVDETRELSVELLTNEKERAEHIMLLDLERNDLGKVCSYGTVAVDELMVVEDYSHVVEPY